MILVTLSVAGHIGTVFHSTKECSTIRQRVPGRRLNKLSLDAAKKLGVETECRHCIFIRRQKGITLTEAQERLER